MKLQIHQDLLKSLEDYDQVIKSTRQLIGSIEIYPLVLKKEEFQNLYIFFNKIMFITLNHLDLIIGLKFLDLSHAMNNEIEANYFARIVILTLHELIEDYHVKFYNKELRKKLEYKIGTSELEAFDEIAKSIKLLKKKYITKLKKLRNSVLGHKDEDALEQFKIMKNIDTNEIFRIGSEIFQVQMKLLGSYTTMLNKL